MVVMSNTEQPGKTPEQAAKIRRTVIILALIALAFYAAIFLTHL